jgi:hypothetical protein
MKKTRSRKNEHGFVMIAALLILLVLTVMGIAVNRGTVTEWRIAMNERHHKEAFLRADAATQLASEILEQSIACLGLDDAGVILAGADSVYVEPGSGGFWREYERDGLAIPTDGMDEDGDGIGDGFDCDTDGDGIGDSVDPDYTCSGAKVDSRQIVFPVQFDAAGNVNIKATNSRPHANINIAGNTVLTPGSAITMAQGYEGTGKGIGTGGASLVYDINVQQIGQNNSVSEICVRYQHVLGSEGDCYY